MSITDNRLKEMLKPKAYRDLWKYMRGQTVALGKDGEMCVYDDDFLGWLKHRKVTD